MSLIETEALILKNYSLAEADKIVLFLTRTHGLIRGVAKGAKRLKSRFGSGLEPFSVISLAYYQKEERELVSIQQIEIKKSLFEKASNVENLKTFSYLAELLSEFAPPNEPNELLYRMTVACLETAEEKNLEMMKLYFEVWLLKLAGYLPSWNVCENCKRQFSPEENAFLAVSFHLYCVNCQKNRGNNLVTFQQRAIIGQILAISPGRFFDLNQNNEDIQQLSKITKRIISHVLGKQVN
jgi:DNA repair protein RecO (recombination protein O)